MTDKKQTKKRPEAMYRLNTRITHEQDAFVKARAKAEGKSEGEMYREIIQFFINAVTK